MSDYYDAIPSHTKYTMDAYVERGQPMGDFLNAVFTNNLIEAVGRADSDNSKALKLIVQYMYNQLPSECWGDKATIKAWIEMGGMQGRKASA
jgi:hypothetical protein